MMMRTTGIAAGARKDRVFSDPTSPKKPVKVNPEEAKLASLTQKERHVIRAVVEGSGAQNKRLASRRPLPSTRSAITSRRSTRSLVANLLELYTYAIKPQLDAALH